MTMPDKLEAKKTVVFFDFDNTISTFDILDDMLLKFSSNDKWKALEKRWKKGGIGSRECLKAQIEGIRISKPDLSKYIARVKLDPYFKKLLSLLASRKIKVFILSDNFDRILRAVLKINGIRGLKLYSNSLQLRGSRLIPSFPFTNGRCDYCAHCKKDTLLANTPAGSVSIYIGDGLSDLYPSKYATLVFAKDELLRYYKEKNLSCAPYRTLKDVHAYLKRSLS